MYPYVLHSNLFNYIKTAINKKFKILVHIN